MRRLALLFSLASCLSSLVGAQPGQTPFSTALRMKLAANEELRRNDSPIQTFCVHRPKTADAPMLIYWPEARYLISLENYEEKDQNWDAIAQLTRYIDLESDVVANQEETGSGTYRLAAPNVISQIKMCLEGRRMIFETPPKPDVGPLNAVVLRVKPHALKYDSSQFECDYDVAELRVTSPGPLLSQIIPVAIPRKGTALYQNVVKSGTMRLSVETWESLATPGRRLKVTADVKTYLKAKRENAPFAVLYASLSDVEADSAGSKP